MRVNRDVDEHPTKEKWHFKRSKNGAVQDLVGNLAAQQIKPEKLIFSERSSCVLAIEDPPKHHRADLYFDSSFPGSCAACRMQRECGVGLCPVPSLLYVRLRRTHQHPSVTAFFLLVEDRMDAVVHDLPTAKAVAALHRAGGRKVEIKPIEHLGGTGRRGAEPSSSRDREQAGLCDDVRRPE